MNRSTKGASKQRRDQINRQVAELRELLPFGDTVRRRFSQLQVMAVTCNYVRKSNYVGQLFAAASQQPATPFPFAQALDAFVLVATRSGKLVSVSENVIDFLGFSAAELLASSEHVNDLTHASDVADVAGQLSAHHDDVSVTCRMKVARSFRSQSAMSNYRTVLLRGRFVQLEQTESYNSEELLLATAAPVATAESEGREFGVLNSNEFNSVLDASFKFRELSSSAEFHFGADESSLLGTSLYEHVHPEDVLTLREKQTQLMNSQNDASAAVVIRIVHHVSLATRWVQAVLRLRSGVSVANRFVLLCCTLIAQSEVELLRKVNTFPVAAPSNLVKMRATAPVLPEFLCVPVSIEKIPPEVSTTTTATTTATVSRKRKSACGQRGAKFPNFGSNNGRSLSGRFPNGIGDPLVCIPNTVEPRGHDDKQTSVKFVGKAPSSRLEYAESVDFCNQLSCAIPATVSVLGEAVASSKITRFDALTPESLTDDDFHARMETEFQLDSHIPTTIHTPEWLTDDENPVTPTTPTTPTTPVRSIATDKAFDDFDFLGADPKDLFVSCDSLPTPEQSPCSSPPREEMQRVPDMQELPVLNADFLEDFLTSFGKPEKHTATTAGGRPHSVVH